MTTYTAPNITYAGFAAGKTYQDTSTNNYIVALVAGDVQTPYALTYILVNTSNGVCLNKNGGPLDITAMLAVMNSITGLANTN